MHLCIRGQGGREEEAAFLVSRRTSRAARSRAYQYFMRHSLFPGYGGEGPSADSSASFDLVFGAKFSESDTHKLHLVR